MAKSMGLKSATAIAQVTIKSGSNIYSLGFGLFVHNTYTF